VESSSLVKGQTYYRVMFVDGLGDAMNLEAVVYLGTIQFDDGGCGFHFQDAESYVRLGVLPPSSDDALVFGVTPDGFSQVIFSLEEAATLLHQVLSRARSRGFPALVPGGGS
jgi:hypothetical protein